MYWTYRGVRLPDHLEFTKTNEAKLDQAGIPYAYMPKYRIRFQAVIDDTGTPAGNQAAMTAEMLAIEALFSVNFGDLILFDDNDQPTVHRLMNAETFGGVKVLSRPGAPTSFGAEYSTYHTFEVMLGAEQNANPAAGGEQIINWVESIEYRGTGGPRRVWTEFTEGDPQQDIVAQRTTIKAVQRGAARALGTYPIPRPLFPLEVEHEDERIYVPGSPEYLGNGAYAYYPLTWAYFFEFANPAFNNPTGRPQ
jgi:hypothetical protein